MVEWALQEEFNYYLWRYIRGNKWLRRCIEVTKLISCKGLVISLDLMQLPTDYIDRFIVSDFVSYCTSLLKFLLPIIEDFLKRHAIKDWSFTFKFSLKQRNFEASVYFPL